MSQQHPISDAISRINNAQKMLHQSVIVNYSKIFYGITQIMLNEGYINYIKCIRIRGVTYIKIYLKYIKNNRPAISSMSVISKPSRRVYKKSKDIENIYDNLGISILSTSKGVVSSASAKKIGTGGEIICNIF